MTIDAWEVRVSVAPDEFIYVATEEEAIRLCEALGYDYKKYDPNVRLTQDIDKIIAHELYWNAYYPLAYEAEVEYKANNPMPKPHFTEWYKPEFECKCEFYDHSHISQCEWEANKEAHIQKAVSVLGERPEHGWGECLSLL